MNNYWVFGQTHLPLQHYGEGIHQEEPDTNYSHHQMNAENKIIY